jgi:cyclin A
MLTPQMRMIVVSWMIEVCDEFVLQPETLHLAVGLLDRFLSATVPQGVPRSVLQMVAVACIMVAAKDLEVRVWGGVTRRWGGAGEGWERAAHLGM